MPRSATIVCMHSNARREEEGVFFEKKKQIEDVRPN
jgi:hypothetical protein